MTALARGNPHLEGELVDRASAGDHQAFITIVHQHDDRLRALAFKLLGGDVHAVDDALQEAYAHAYRGFSEFRRDADVGTWLYRIAYNVCVDELRRARRRPQPVDTRDPHSDRPTSGSGPEAVVSAADAMVRALAALPHDQRVAVVLVDGEGFNYEAAAELMGVAAGTVASRLSRARTAIRRQIGEDHP